MRGNLELLPWAWMYQGEKNVGNWAILASACWTQVDDFWCRSYA